MVDDFRIKNIAQNTNYSCKIIQNIISQTVKEQYEEGPTFKFLMGSWAESGPGVPLLNFEGDPGSRVPGSWSHFYTMPIETGHLSIFNTLTLIRGVATQISFGRSNKNRDLSSNDFFICKTFICVFLRTMNSQQILLTCFSNQILKLQEVGCQIKH